MAFSKIQRTLIFKIVTGFCLLFFISSCKQESTYRTLYGDALGTTYTIHYRGQELKSVQDSIQYIINELNQSVSTYVPSSAISKINKGDTTLVVDTFFETLFKKSKRIYKETDGYFNPAVGVLVNAWGFGPHGLEKEPHLDSIQQLLKFTDFNLVQLNHQKVKRKYPETALDFNAIGKGYLVDLISQFFEKKGYKNYLIEIGGEIKVKGKKSKRQNWKIGIQDPSDTSKDSYQLSLELNNESVASSGNYRKFRFSFEDKLVHTINPKTGLAKESDLLGATVIAPIDCADVDAYATALMAMGLEKSRLFLEKQNHLKAILIAKENDSIKTIKIGSFN